MNGKSVDSRWHEMEEVIKVAVSAWPIVFAAVTAQSRCLESYDLRVLTWSSVEIVCTFQD